MMRFITILLSLLLGAVPSAIAGSMSETLMVSGAYVRALPPTSEVTSGYLLIANHGDQDVEITGAASSIAKAVEFHQVETKEGMMKMSRMDKVVVQAHGSLEFAPGGKHLMFLGLKRPLKDGETLTIELELADQSKLIVDAEVRDIRQKRQHENQEHEGDHEQGHHGH